MPKTKGFTLLEVIIAVIMLVILGASSVYILHAVLRAWSSQEKRAGLEIDIDSGLENISRDLRQAKDACAINANEIRFTVEESGADNDYILYFYNEDDPYPPSFPDPDALYELRKAALDTDINGGLEDAGVIMISGVLPPPASELTFTTPQAFDYAIHTRKSVDFATSTGTVSGDISAGRAVNNEAGMTITGSITESSAVLMPLVSLLRYKGIASHTVSGDQTFLNGTTYSGIYYVDGDVTIESNVTINGTVVSTGNINMQNSTNLTLNPSSPYPALVSGDRIDGIKSRGLANSSVSGLVFTRAGLDLDSSATNSFDATVIADNDMGITNSTDFELTYDSGIKSSLPPYFYEILVIDISVKKTDETIRSRTEIRPRNA